MQLKPRFIYPYDEVMVLTETLNNDNRIEDTFFYYRTLPLTLLQTDKRKALEYCLVHGDVRRWINNGGNYDDGSDNDNEAESDDESDSVSESESDGDDDERLAPLVF